MPKKAPWKKSEQSLVCFVQALRGRMVVVELLNDVALRGKLVEADDSMNVSLTDVVSESPDGDRKELGQVWVKGKCEGCLLFPALLTTHYAPISQQKEFKCSGMKIRYIHTPKSVEVSETVEKHRVEMRLVAMKHYHTDHAKLNLKRDTMFSSSSFSFSSGAAATASAQPDVHASSSES